MFQQVFFWWSFTEALQTYSEPCQTFRMVLLAKIVNAWKSLTIFAKGSILDVWQGFEYVFTLASPQHAIQISLLNSISSIVDYFTISDTLTGWKLFLFGVFLVRILFSRIWTEYGELRRNRISLHIQSECGKARTTKTPNTDTFHAASVDDVVDDGELFFDMVYRRKWIMSCF